MAVNSETVRVDLVHPSPVQEEIHWPRHEDAISMSFPRLDKITFSAHGKKPLEMTANEGADKATYTPDTDFSLLGKMYLQLTLPMIAVIKEAKKSVRICWPSYIGHNLIDAASLHLSSENRLELDAKDLDAFGKTIFRSADKDEAYDKMVGNVPELTRWRTVLPRYDTSTPLIWSCCTASYSQVPLYLYKSKQGGDSLSVKVEIKFNRSIIKLLRMQKYMLADHSKIVPGKFYSPEDGEGDWIDIKCNLKYIEGYNKTTTKLPFPALLGYYRNISEEEKKATVNECADETKSAYYVDYYIYDFLRDRTQNPIDGKLAVNFSLDSPYPVKTMAILAQNVETEKRAQRSNYTTNPDDYHDGENPIVSAVIKYGDKVRETLTGHDMNILVPDAFQFPGVSPSKGHNFISFSQMMREWYADGRTDHTGVSFANKAAKLAVSLGNNNPFGSEQELSVADTVENKEDEVLTFQTPVAKPQDGDATRTQYHVDLRCIILRKLTFELGADRVLRAIRADVATPERNVKQQ